MSSNPSLANAVFRLSHQQERAWSQHERGVTQFAQCSIAIEGKLDAARLQSAITSVVSKYEILRTQLRRQSGIKLPFQTIQEAADFHFEQSAATDTERAMQTERQQLLQSEQAAPLRARLIGHDPARHTLILTLPVSCADSTTLERLVSEISAAYGNGEQESDDPMQYVDLAEWQNELLASDEVKPGRTFWRTHCGAIDFAAIQNATLPFEQKGDTAFSAESLAFPSAIPDITAPASRLGVGLEDVLLAAWDALLMRLLARQDVTVGYDFDGRRYDELKAALGPLARALPLKTQCSAEATFSTLLKEVHLLADEARNWQESFSWSQLFENDAPDLPFSFGYHDLGSSSEIGGVRFELERVYVISERFKLRLVAARRGSELMLEFHYDSSSLSRKVVERIASWYQNLLAAAVANPATAISKLPLLSEAERRQLLVEWNQTAASYAAEQCLHQLFEAQAASTPSREALRFGEQACSYRELNERANQLARYLRKQGVGPDKLVGLCLERSAETMVAVLAILKAGGAYVPLNPDNPPARLQQQLEGAVAVITESKLTGQIPQFPGTTIVLDLDHGQWASEATSNPACTTNPENLVYVIYTSGSTGVPKGVAVRHRNLVNYADFISKRLDLAKCPDGLQFATVSTLGADLGNTCIYPSLISGGTLHVVGYETATDATRLAQYTAKHPIDVLKIVPSHLAALLQSHSGPEQARKLLPRKYLIFGGETLTPKLVEKIESLNPACEILNHYGPTETTVGSLTLKLKDYDWKTKQLASIPIGRPIQNTQLYVLDQNLEPVPAGVVGELYIAGAGVTAGYLNQPEKTAERFLNNPFSTDPNSKMYRAGDLVRYLEDGAVEFLGRGDDQVKVRGFRIELGEIESVLLQHAGVKQALVLARENEQGDKRLLGYVIAQSSATQNSGKDLTGDDLREYLKQHVPDYMVPQAVVILPKFPLTPNGKIDRQALPEPEQVTKRAYIAPSNDTERTIAEIWAEVLRRDATSISVDDNFFDLGGHSLMAARLVMEMEKALGRKIPLAALFRGPSVGSMARLIQEGSEATPDPIVMQLQAGTGTPFFAVVGPGINAVGYMALAQAMGRQQTFYKLQLHRAVKPDTPITLDDMRGFARMYIQAMRTVQPCGPYFIGGMCAGTHIAEQMVLQLEAEGEKVALLAVFDTWVRQNTQIRWKWLIYYYRNRIRDLVRLGKKQQLAMLRGAVTKKMRRFSSPFTKPIETSWAKLYWPGKEFTTPLFEAPVALFKRPRQPFYYLKDEAMGWGERSLGGVHIYRIDFPHRMLRDPYVRELARQLLVCIAGASSPTRIERLPVWPTVSEAQPSPSDVRA